jgi:hypothetical protein
MLPLALFAVVWTAVVVVLAEEVSDSVVIPFSFLAGILFIFGAAFWVGRAGHKPDVVAEERVEVVSLSGR